MPDNVCTQFSDTGDVSFIATAATIGKRFLAPSAVRSGGPGLSTDLDNLHKMAHAPANGAAAGVNKYDVPLDGRGSIHGVPGRIVPVTADGAIGFGERIVVGATGKAKSYDGAVDGLAGTLPVIVGTAMTSAADGADAEIKLSL